MMTPLQVSLQQLFENREILILGFGREGRSTYQFLRSIFPKKEIWIMDQKNISLSEFADPDLHQEPEYLKNIERFQVIFKTPGIAIHDASVQGAVHRGTMVTSQMNEFLRVYSSQVIGITGTKGKSTTSSMVFEMMKSAGQDVVYGGNIGTPVFELAPNIQSSTHIVVEMSSYQLETVLFSPHIAAILNLFSEHLNYHRTVQNYLLAKTRITQFQHSGDYFFFNDSIPMIKNLTTKTEANPIALSASEREKRLVLYSAELARFPKIVREHNAPAAIMIVEKLGLTEEQIRKGVGSFQTLPHRLEKVGTYRKVTFYDDTLATIPEATIAAINDLEKIDVLLLGGFDRGIQHDAVIEKAVAAKIPHFVLFPTSGLKMANKIASMNVKKPPTVDLVENMRDAVALCYKYLPAGGVAVLSPASPSFGTFTDYEDKSAQFRAAVVELGHA